MRVSFSSLRARLLLLISLALVPFLGLILYTSREEKRVSLIEAQGRVLERARNVAADQGRWIEGARQVLVLLAHLPQVRQYVEEGTEEQASGEVVAAAASSRNCNAQMADLLKHYPHYSNFGAVAPDGTVFCSAVDHAGTISVRDKAFFRRAIETRTLAVGDYEHDPLLGKSSLSFGYPVTDSAGQVTAVVFAGLELGWFHRWVADTPLPQGSMLTVTDRNGTVMVVVPGPATWVGRPLSEAPRIKAILDRKSGVGEAPGPNGAPSFFAFAPLHAASKEVEAYVGIGIPRGAALAEVRQVTGNNSVLALVGILALIAGWFGSDVFVVRRMKALVHATRRVTAGDLRVRTGLPYEQNELGQLARAFDEMASSLERRYDQSQALAHAAGALNRRLLPHAVFESICQEALTVFKVEAASVQLFEPDADVGTVVASRGIEADADACWVLSREDVRRQLDAGGAVTILDDARDLSARVPAAVRESGFKKILCAVMLHEGEPLGVLTIYSRQPVPAFGAEDQALALTFADRAVVAIVNAQLYSDKLRQLEALTALYTGAQRLSGSLDLQQQAEDVARTCVEGFGARLAWLSRVEPDGRTRLLSSFPAEDHFRLWNELGPDGSFAGGDRNAARLARKPRIISDIAAHSRLGAWHDAALAEGLRSAAAFPLMARDKTYGELVLYSHEPGFFRPDRVEFFQAYAHLAAAAFENARLFEEAGQRLEHLNALRAIDSAITGSLDLRLSLDVCLDQVINQLKVDAADVLLLRPLTQTLEFVAGRGFYTTALRHTTLRMGEGLAGQSAMERKVVNVPDLTVRQGSLAQAPLLDSERFVSYYAVPLTAKGQVKGVLEIFHRSALDASQEWLEFAQSLARQAAIAIDNSAMFDDLQRSNTELILAYETTLEGWSRALDLRDKETEGHTRRVSEMSLRLGRALGMSEAELVHVRRGALLHDIGKMGVPDRILLKPDKLSEEEWEIMKLHPVYAYELLSPISFLRPALDIPYCHHEKWDGTGYPRGLKGEAIPFAARIFAVVDIWDALRSDRPYRPAWPVEKARDYIRSISGTHLDPVVAEVFLAEVVEIDEPVRVEASLSA